ncbi:MAG: hypothetical protein K2X46_02480 [Roseomonas sp.]|nr:hypothetical protein [Roseomonas sp.]
MQIALCCPYRIAPVSGGMREGRGHWCRQISFLMMPSQTLRLFTAERAAQAILSGVFAEALRWVIEPMLAGQPPSSNSASTSIGMSE